MSEKYLSVGEQKDVEAIRRVSAFTKKVTRLNALTSVLSVREDFDLAKAECEASSGLEALGAKGGLQEMLSAQMLSVHQLQQISISMANKDIPQEAKQYFTNTAIKLANVFVQQASVLNRLQGNCEQKVVVERVDVHNGGQAVVGNIHRG